MATFEYDFITDKFDVISQDAYRVGHVEAIRYDPHDWTILGLVVKCDKEVSEKIGAGSSKSRILIRPDNYVLRDVLLLSDSLEDAKAYIKPDVDTYASVANLTGKKVTTADNMPLGMIKSVIVDLDGWFVHSFTIRLDKEAYAPLGLKKLLFSKDVSGITTDHVSVVSDSVVLTLTMSQVKDVVVVN